MADQIEADDAGPQISNADDFAKWLHEPQVADTSAVLATRAALRVVPFAINPVPYHSVMVDLEYIEKAIFSIFRATAAALFTVKHLQESPKGLKIALTTSEYLNAAFNAALSAASNSNQSVVNLIRPAAEAAKVASALHRHVFNERREFDASNSSSRQWLDLYSSKATFDAVNEAANGIILSITDQPERKSGHIILGYIK